MMKKSILSLLIAGVLIISGCSNSNEKKQSETGTVEKTFKLIDINDLTENSISLFADNWFVLTAGNDSAFNLMTISWGSFGYLWEVPTATIFIRHTRHTYPFIDNGKYFTLCAFDETYRDKVQFIGSNSGRDTDKIKETGLTPVKTDLGNVYYEEARLVIECEKLYKMDMNPTNAPEDIQQKFYVGKDADQRMFIGKIINAWVKE